MSDMTQAPTVVCPACKGEFECVDGWEMKVGSEMACPLCDQTIAIMDEDYTRYWWWAVVKPAPAPPAEEPKR